MGHHRRWRPTKGLPITATPQLDLTLVLPDGTRQPIALPAGAEAGRAAAKIALTLDIAGAGLGGWTLVRDGSGVEIPAGVLLGDAGLLPDESVRLMANATGPLTAEHPSTPPTQAYSTPPAYPTPPSYAGQAPAASFVPPQPAPSWGAVPAPPAPQARSGNSTRYALIAGFGALIAVIAVLGTLLATSGSDDVVAPAPPIDFDSGQPSPPPAETPDEGSTEPADTPSGGGSGLGDTPLSQSGGVTSFSVELPDSWDAAQLDEQQDTSSSTVTRSRTKLNAPTGGASIVVDVLRGFDTPASENRASLDATYAASQRNYRRVAFLSVPIGSTTGYEWRYELYDDDKSRMARRANVMFDLGGASFAVMASAPTSTPFSELSRLARRVARTVEP
ncbi:MAG: hypothetical protein JHD16_01270 [Solirubrobacteraceae bacterium]|nr:hypothetical protein [Solirubrobacteraceae bacterium]